MDQNCSVTDQVGETGNARRGVRLSYRAIAWISLALVVVMAGGVTLGAVYVRMSWKVSRYNKLAEDFDHLRNRYQELQRVSRQHSEQMASLETLANEVSVAYGLQEPASTKASGVAELVDNPITPTVKESIQEYNFLKAASFGGVYRRSSYQWMIHTQPTLWPMNGIVRSSFGVRSDPFSGEGAFHSGIDLAAPTGTQVHVTADGVITSAGWSGGYGKLIVVDHGNGIQTYYAHLSRVAVVPGQEVYRGQTVGYSGSTGRSTGPHMHYEVRLGGTPVNPYKYMIRGERPLAGRMQAKAATMSHNDLGL